MNIFKFGPFPFRIFNIGKIKFADDNSSTNPADVYSFIIEMNALLGIGLFSTVIHSLIYDWTFLKIYLLLLPLYLVFILLTRNIKENPKRKTLMLATWNGKKS